MASTKIVSGTRVKVTQDIPVLGISAGAIGNVSWVKNQGEVNQYGVLLSGHPREQILSDLEIEVYAPTVATPAITTNPIQAALDAQNTCGETKVAIKCPHCGEEYSIIVK